MDKKWDIRFLEMARQYASWSKDPSSKIGAVCVDADTRRILSGGYNGFPRNIRDTTSRLNDREKKYKYVVHAEMNAIYNATRSGISLDGAHLYCYGLPVCSECAKGIIQVGIQRVVCSYDNSKTSTKWTDSWSDTLDIFHEAGVSTRVLCIDR